MFHKSKRVHTSDNLNYAPKSKSIQTYGSVSKKPSLLKSVYKTVLGAVSSDNKPTTDTTGYTFAEHVRNMCKTPRFNSLVHVSHRFSYKDKVQLCAIWKIGTTTLKRLFMMKNVNGLKRFTDPYSISFLKQYEEKSLTMSNVNTAIRMMFVRNPYHRLLSGYVDKVLAPNPVYWKLIGVPALKMVRSNASAHSCRCGHDLTFPEYVKAAVMALGISPVTLKPMNYRPPLDRDGHFETMSILCKPCRVKYDFVGKLESFNTDVNALLKLLDMPQTAEIFRTNGSRLATLDAIRDTTYQPFDPDFQKGFQACEISRSEALKRAWLKLQVRGLVGGHDLNLSDETMSTMSYTDFLNHAIAANKNSTKQECRDIKRSFYREFYQSVEDNVLEAVKIVYADDFRIFQYDDTPL